MKLLILAQKVNINDPVLGFFHNWIREFSKYCELITVVCLYEGEHNLPSNVKVHSLGKEDGQSRTKYIKNFFKYIWSERKNYDSVFVHMNQEYILLGGWLWKLLKKNIYMWRNHHAGTILTDIAASFCNNVFCTSKYSYTAKYEKTIFMPVGVDIDNFQIEEIPNRVTNSVLFLGRISPSKKVDLFVDAINLLTKKGIEIKATVCGSPLPKDEKYYEDVKKKAGANINFIPGIPKSETPKVFYSNQIFINLSSSGMYDKTIFEAMVCGCLVLVSNDNLKGQISEEYIFKEGDLEELSMKLEKLLSYTEEKRNMTINELKKFAFKHTLTNLSKRLFEVLK